MLGNLNYTQIDFSFLVRTSGISFAGLFNGQGVSMPNNRNYSSDKNTLENINSDDKYSVTGESEFSRESTIPFDQDEVLSERNYSVGEMEKIGRYKYQSKKISDQPDISQNRGRGPQGFRRTDETLKEDVSEALYRCTDVDASEILIEVSLGKVTMKGFVEDVVQKDAAVKAIENLAGIEEVYNEIRVRGHYSADQDKPSKYGLMNNITGMN
jgi:osmotically-inducible protein OsmY